MNSKNTIFKIVKLPKFKPYIPALNDEYSNLNFKKFCDSKDFERFSLPSSPDVSFFKNSDVAASRFSTLSDIIKIYKYNELISNFNLDEYNTSFHSESTFYNKTNNPRIISTKTQTSAKINNIKKFICEFCHKPYTRKYNLNRHIENRHSNYNGKICAYCTKRIIRIKEHIKICRIKHMNKKRLAKKFIKKKKIKSRECNIDRLDNDLNDLTISPPNFSILIDEVNISNYEDYNDFRCFKDYVIGFGGTMKTYFGRSKKDGEYLAIKIDINKNKNQRP